MCGRYTQHHSTDQVVLRFDVTETVAEAGERYNVAPTQMMPVIYGKGSGRVLGSFRWGLIPFWAKDPAIGNKLINARAELVSEKPSFRSAFARRRCLVPADGYFEWRKEDSRKQPYYYQLTDGELFAFAGLWEEWKSPDGEPLRTFTIITTAPNELAAIAHDRMPAILPREAEAGWLSHDHASEAELLALLAPYPASKMHAYPVSPRINVPVVDDASLIAPIGAEIAPNQQSLF